MVIVGHRVGFAIMEAARQIGKSRCFGCEIIRFEHTSPALGGLVAKFHVILPPPQADGMRQLARPVLFWLSGLTCTDENFVVKAGPTACRVMAGGDCPLVLICPDTSPRGAGIEGEDTSWSFGSGAGFYVDATRDKWARNYRMYSYVTEELPAVVKATLGDQVDLSRAGITGHSMGGHGALVLAQRCPGQYLSVSAFAPIANPTQSPWGKVALDGYLREREEWDNYDATVLMAKQQHPPFPFAPIVIDQGKQDTFLNTELYPDSFLASCQKVDQEVDLQYREGYDHGYFFVSSFLERHLRHHYDVLSRPQNQPLS